MKQCTKCESTFPATIEYFTQNKKAVDGLHYYCKGCTRRISQLYRSTPEGLAKSRAAGRKSTKKYRAVSKFADAQHSQPLLAAKTKIRQALYMGRKLQGWPQASKIGMLYGCSFSFLQKHLEATLPDYMAYTEVHIDHIVPLNTAQNLEELEALQHWSNLQWLPGGENLCKGSALPENWQERKENLLRLYKAKYTTL